MNPTIQLRHSELRAAGTRSTRSNATQMIAVAHAIAATTVIIFISARNLITKRREP